MKTTAFGAVLALCLGSVTAQEQWSFRDQPWKGTLTSDPVTEGLCDSTKQLSGYYSIEGSKSKNYFFWFFESRSKPSEDPIVLWLTGGPGCSSTLALLEENGPCTVNKDLTTKKNEQSWTSKANVIWVDQPVGTGWSYGDQSEYDHDEKGVAEDMFHFLQAFFKANPAYQKQKFFVFGESYAGHYVPAVSHRVFEGNQKKEGLHLNLAGIGIGNGLTDPEVQYGYYAQMAYNNTYGVKAVTETQHQAMVTSTPTCISMIKQCQKTSIACTIAELFCNYNLIMPYQQSGLNVYDIREKCAKPPLCYDFEAVGKWLNRPETKKALHVRPESGDWQSCNMDVNRGFMGDWMKNYQQLIPPMLKEGIRVLIYAGDADFICNWMGNKAWTLAMEWEGKQDFIKAKDHDWKLSGKSKRAGVARTTKGFTFLQVHEAGHMVPMNQPEASLAMLNSFLEGKEFAQQEEEQHKTEVATQAVDEKKEFQAFRADKRERTIGMVESLFETS